MGDYLHNGCIMSIHKCLGGVIFCAFGGLDHECNRTTPRMLACETCMGCLSILLISTFIPSEGQKYR